MIFVLCLTSFVGANAQSIFVKDYGLSKQPQRFFGVENGIQLNDNMFGVVTSVAGANSTRSMILYDSTGASMSTGITPPASWSGLSSPLYFKMHQRFILMSGITDSIGGKLNPYTELYDYNGSKIWANNSISLSFATPVENNNVLGITNESNFSLVKLDASGKKIWSVFKDTLVGRILSDSLLMSSSCGVVGGKHWVYISSVQSDSSLLVFVDSNQRIISREIFISNNTLKIASTSDKIFLFRTHLDTTVSYFKPTGHQVEVYDEMFKLKNTISNPTCGPSSIVDFEIVEGLLYLLIHIYESRISPIINYSEVQKLNLQGKILQRNYYRFWLMNSGKTNVNIGQSTDFRTLDVCVDKGYLLTGYISNGLDRRTVALKLDSNGLGNDTLQIPVDRLPLMHWDSTCISTSIEDIHSQRQQISVYPNPSKSTLNLSISGVKELNYLITNFNGQTILTGNFISSTQVDVSKFPNGIYFLHFQSEEISETRKIIVSH